MMGNWKTCHPSKVHFGRALWDPPWSTTLTFPMKQIKAMSHDFQVILPFSRRSHAFQLPTSTIKPLQESLTKPSQFVQRDLKTLLLPMASKTFISLALMLFFFASGALGGGITCESLGKSMCAYAVSSAGMRCVLEKHVRRGGQEAYTCGTSDIHVDGIKNRVETDECVEACGLNRGTLGISSDSLLDSNFRQKLCSPACYRGCPNVVDLYFNLAAGEGVFLPRLCEAQQTNTRRAMAEIRSSGVSLAASPEPGKVDASAPTRSWELFAPAEPPM